MSPKTKKILIGSGVLLTGIIGYFLISRSGKSGSSANGSASTSYRINQISRPTNVSSGSATFSGFSKTSKSIF